MNLLWKRWLLPGLYFVILAMAWISVLFIGGTLGPYGWWVLMGFGVVGLISSVVCFTIIAVSWLQKGNLRLNIVVLLVLSIFAAWPGGWILGIGQIAYPADLDCVEPAISIRLPVDELVLVGWGGDTLEHNYHVWLPVGRWAYDLISPERTDSSRLEDYGIFGVEVLAPISGWIVGAYDAEIDIEPGSRDFISNNGNYVYILIEETGTYLVIAHLRQGSLMVTEGQYVLEGTPIAQVGNSGTSSEPHIHIHHQRQNPREVILLAEGLPLYFRDIDGPAMPLGGHKLENGISVPIGAMISPINR